MIIADGKRQLGFAVNVASPGDFRSEFSICCCLFRVCCVHFYNNKKISDPKFLVNTKLREALVDIWCRVTQRVGSSQLGRVDLGRNLSLGDIFVGFGEQYFIRTLFSTLRISNSHFESWISLLC